MKFIVNSRLFLQSVFEMRIPSSLQHPEVSSSFYFKLLVRVLTLHTANALTWGDWGGYSQQEWYFYPWDGPYWAGSHLQLLLRSKSLIIQLRGDVSDTQNIRLGKEHKESVNNWKIKKITSQHLCGYTQR
jgi:hypothetical protein